MKIPRTRAQLLGTIVLAAAALTGCTSPAESPAPTTSPGLRQVACPADVEVHVLVQHTCLRFRVPEDRRHPTNRSVELFLVRIAPEGPVSADPQLTLGGDIGDALGFGGMVPLAERVHRVTYMLEPRGTGHSSPSMACTESVAVTASSADEPTRIATSAHACLMRLRAAGDDPAWFGPDDVAADAEAVRIAIGATRWNVITYGSSSIYVAALVRRFPGTLRTIVLDSPAPLASQYASAASVWTAWTRLAAICVKTKHCPGSSGRAVQSWPRTAAGFAADPLVVQGPSGPLTVDADVLALLVRSMLGGDGPRPAAAVPDLLTALARRSLPAEAASRLAADSSACLGHRPLCTRAHSLAAYLTALCPLLAQVPGPSLPDLDGSTALDPVRTFGRACAGWPSTPLDSRPIPTGIPTLVLTGQLDPYVDASTVRGWAGRPHAYLVSVPGQTHNAIGFNDCTIDLRNAWVDNPTHPPGTACLTTMPPPPFPT